MSLLGTSIFGIKGADVQAVQVAESTENSTTEEVREDASHVGESDGEQDKTSLHIKKKM